MIQQKLRLQDVVEPKDDTIDLGALLGVLWRGKFVIMAAALACVLLGGYYAYAVAVPVYRATTVVVLESREAQIAGLDSVIGGLMGSDRSVVNTEVEVLSGRSLMGRVVDDLNLLNDPEFNSSLREPGFMSGVRVALSALLGAAVPEELSPELQAQAERDRTITELLSKITVSNVPQSLVFNITLETRSPVKSARIADALARLYIDDQLQVKFAATDEATKWLTARVTEMKAELEGAETAVRAFRSTTDLIDAETLDALDRQVLDTRNQATAMQAEADTLQVRLATLRAAQGRMAQAVAAGDTDLVRLAEAAAAPGSAGTGSAAEFDDRFAALVARTEQDAERALLRASTLRQAGETLASEIARQSEDLIRQQQLVREAESSRLIYEHFQTRLKETAVQQGIQQADSRVLSPAVVPAEPAAPRKSLILAMSGVIGLMLGAGLVLTWEMRASGQRTARDLEGLTGRIVLGQVPQIPRRQRKQALTYLAEKPTSAAAEAVRNLRTSILLSDIDKAPKVIALTSSVPGEGKTTLTLALAQNLTAMGKRVLVIEGDIRRRVFSQYFTITEEHGLIAVMSGAVRLADAVHPEPGLGDILIGEKSATSATDLFSSQAFAALLAQARAAYDFVLLDTAPVLVVPDARVIGQHVDTTVFVVRWDSTTSTQVTEALRLLETVNVKVAGLVLSQISPEGMRRYGYGESYGAYAAYGKKYYNN